MRNIFGNKTSQEVLKEAKEKAIVAEKTQKISQDAKAILATGIAIKYRDDIDMATKDIVRLMISNTESDPVKFAFFCKTCLSKLSVHYELLDAINRDAE